MSFSKSALIIYGVREYTLLLKTGSLHNLIGLAAMVYEPLYHAQEIETIELSSGCFLQCESTRSCNISGLFFNKTIIPLTLVGYETIIANSALRASLAIIHIISNARSWNNC